MCANFAVNKSSVNILKVAQRLFLAIFFALAFLSPCPAEAIEENATVTPDAKDSGLVTKTLDGLHFAVPPDMPIEKKDGIVAPMQLSEYVSIKFDNLQERVAKIEETVSKIYQDLSLIKKNLDAIADSSSSALKDLRE